jgi:hypothetical protein
MRARMLFAIKAVVKRQNNPVVVAFGKIAVIKEHKQLHTRVIPEAQAIITFIKSEIPLEVNLVPRPKI